MRCSFHKERVKNVVHSLSLIDWLTSSRVILLLTLVLLAKSRLIVFQDFLLSITFLSQQKAS